MRPSRFGASLIVAVIAVLLGLSGAQAQTRQYSPAFTISGQVNTPRSYALQDLQVLPSTDLEVEYIAAGQTEHSTYTGVRLLDLLMAAGPQFDVSQRNESLRWYVLVTATDSYQAVVSWGEIDPSFGAQNVLVAYQENGQPLGPDDGMARLVVPGDKHGGRSVHGWPLPVDQPRSGHGRRYADPVIPPRTG